jgi:hypothetical protein
MAENKSSTDNASKDWSRWQWTLAYSVTTVVGIFIMLAMTSIVLSDFLGN